MNSTRTEGSRYYFRTCHLSCYCLQHLSLPQPPSFLLNSLALRAPNRFRFSPPHPSSSRPWAESCHTSNLPEFAGNQVC